MAAAHLDVEHDFKNLSAVWKELSGFTVDLLPAKSPYYDYITHFSSCVRVNFYEIVSNLW